MTTFSTRSDSDLLAGFRAAVDAFLDRTLQDKLATDAGAHLAVPVSVLRDFLGGGGERLRPMYCYCGWLAGGGDPDDPTVVRLGAAVELHHARYLPLPGLGENAAVLLGDLCASWADELFGSMREARRMFARMRTELVVGQYLDLCATGTVQQALTVDRYKSGSYTVQRPLHIGAAAAGADARVLAACSAYGLPLGQAFQMCDDLEDVMGHPGRLREGKSTVVVALAVRRADPAQRLRLGALLGDPGLDEAGAAEARAIIAATGAVSVTTEMIGEYRERALSALRAAPFPAEVARLLTILAGCDST
ncbi:polyprenyl synthetase family protein [Actinomadura rugatobispora]|uniref:Polyprenyl synthetase family protein n=1 Tax=Actinomadura rugatobispora TaxID=1994 RepID=A0ABW1A6E7_9ACTN